MGRAVFNRPIWIFLALFLSGQVLFARIVAPLRSSIEEMPPPLGPVAMKALAFGDEEFLFRATARWLQDVGDGGGRIRPLRDYDYDRVVGWLRALDGIDNRSDYIYELAAHYFGAIGDPSGAPTRVGKIVDYFCTAALAQPERRWPWMVWAAEKTRTVVKDPVLAGRMARDLMSLHGNPAVPPWLPLLAPPLYRIAGDEFAARSVEMLPDIMELKQKLSEELKKSRSEKGGLVRAEAQRKKM